jgi:hypothetical protein
MTFNDWVMIGLLLFGLWLFLYDVKMWMFPQRRGRVLAVEDQLEAAKKACSCNSAKMGRSYVNAAVRLEDGELTTVQVSPCLFCMDKVTIGSQIGVNQVGDRLIARRYIDIFGRGLPNDDIPPPSPEEIRAQSGQGVSE